MENDNKVEWIKFHDDAEMPQKAGVAEAGYDIKVVSATVCGDIIKYKLGVGIQLPTAPKGYRYHALILPRSSISKMDLLLCNSVGLIDNSYRGEMQAHFMLTEEREFANVYEVGDRCVQLMITLEPLLEVSDTWATNIDNTERGVGGFGSTGHR